MRNLKRILPTALAWALFNGSINTYALEPTDVTMDGLFHLVDFETQEILEGAYGSFRDAKSVYNNIKEDYTNLGIVKDGETYEAEYALSLFKVNDACDFEITYTNTSDGTEGTLNGCYGVDAAYLYTDDEGQYATFSLSGVTGQTALENVTVVPLQNVYVNLSMFTVHDGILYHMIKGEMEDDYFAYIVSHGTAPSYLEEGRAYYSYDGHYFYSDDMLYQMLDDYRSGIRNNSVNSEDPWYDWYQFVSHRTITHATMEQLRTYFYEQMGLKGPITSYLDNDKDGTHDVLNESQFYGLEDSFFQYQYEFGANALMMLAISQLESSDGRSSLSFTRNNLYSHAAYDSEAEAEKGRYSDIRNSIYSHAKYYLSGSYLSPMKEQYNGGFFGNKSAGMNVRYSSDPYWGEKAAAAYRALDEALGANDSSQVRLGIRTVEDETIVYKDPSTETPLYTTGEMPDMAFVILGEESNDAGDWYKIQSDATLDDNHAVDLSYYYRWKEDVAYIKQDSVQIILNDPVEEASYATVTFRADGGRFPGGEEEVVYELPSGSDAIIAVPQKDHAEFTGYDMDTAVVDADIEYTAQYRALNDVVLSSMPKVEYELNDRIDLKNGKIRVIYDDGSDMERDFTSSMVDGYDMTADGEQTVDVTYAGITNSYTIEVSAEKDEARAAMKESILSLINDYSDSEELTEDDVNRILSVKQEMDRTVQPYLSMPEFRAFDTILRKAYQDRIRYVVDGEHFNFAVSGLSLSIPLEEGQLEKKDTDQDTYRISMNSGVRSLASEMFEKEAKFLGETILEKFKITLTKNMDAIDTDATFLCTINRPSDSVGGDVYTVLAFDAQDGSLIKCYTRQTTNTISFMTAGTGEYVLLTRNTSNQYVGTDPVETVTEETSNTDVRAIISQIAFALIALILIVFGSMYLIGKRRRKKNVVIHQERRRLHEKDSNNLEVTQALEILNTEMLRLDDIKKADEKRTRGMQDGSASRNRDDALKKIEEVFHQTKPQAPAQPSNASKKPSEVQRKPEPKEEPKPTEAQTAKEEPKSQPVSLTETASKLAEEVLKTQPQTEEPKESTSKEESDDQHDHTAG